MLCRTWHPNNVAIPGRKLHMRVVGVDGCRQGWLCAVLGDETGQFTFELQSDLDGILTAYHDAVCIGIDIPVGLTECGYRDCDCQARRLLGWPRSASVFLTPPRSSRPRE
jgi:predicted RNase H-like nuclease